MPFQNIIREHPSVECGLIFHIHNEPVPVPLKNVSIKTKIVDFVAEVTIEQKYVNQVKIFTKYFASANHRFIGYYCWLISAKWEIVNNIFPIIFLMNNFIIAVNNSQAHIYVSELKLARECPFHKTLQKTLKLS